MGSADMNVDADMPPPMQSAGGSFEPKMLSVLREGYGLSALKADAVAGLTVAIVALPLSMALAIASGATPDSGLFSAIVGGFCISLLSGSRFQIGGPAGAFIVLVAAIIERRGFDGLLLSTFMAGGLLIIGGMLRLGSAMRFMPHAVIVGFTAGIAILIFASQIHDLFGLTLPDKEPSEFLPRLEALTASIGTTNIAALALALASLGVMVALRVFRPTWPNLLIGVALSTLAALLLHLPVETIGTRFGGIASHLPAPRLPDLGPTALIAALPDACFIALLGGIESLLSAVVADGMSNRRHRSNAELVAQGVGNMASSLFGGICVTGAIARTATNIRAGARTPVAGMLHSLFLLGFIMLAAPLAALIPLASLAAVLTIVCWNMLDRTAIGHEVSQSWQGAAVLGATLATTVFANLIAGIAAGCVLSMVFALLGRSRNAAS
ncbi:MAG: SulP family inorganic anion transporter [Beijerinckiaceae bacterium]|nr:SulP family inorganic anion transporter [Beijerinckiaceae bacterium]